MEKYNVGEQTLFHRAVTTKKNILLISPSRSGKTTFGSILSVATDYNIQDENCIQKKTFGPFCTLTQRKIPFNPNTYVYQNTRQTCSKRDKPLIHSRL
jgi:hypothetical protein